MSDRHIRILRKRNQILEVAKSIFHRAGSRHVHHSRLVDMLHEVWEHPNRHNIPNYAWEFCRGYERAMVDCHWHKVIWVFPWQGEVYGSWSELPESGKQFFRAPKHTGFHVYKEKRRACFTGSQEAFDMLLSGNQDDIDRAAKIMEEEEDNYERVRKES